MIIATFSGVRFLTETTEPSVAYQYSAAFARYLIKNKITNIVLGYDGRSSATTFLPYIISALKDFKINYIGIVPTPTVQQLVKLADQPTAGVICTASHNNEKWCGLKFVDSNSIFLSPKNCDIVYNDLQTEQINPKDIENAKNFITAKTPLKNCTFTDNQAAILQHIEAILATNKISKSIISDANLSISFNGMCASGSAYIELLCKIFNVNLVEPYNMTLGRLPDFPEPTVQNLQEFENHCKTLQIDCAFAVDPDADRCVMLADGKVISEELTLAAAVTGYLSLNKSNFVVKNVSTSRATDAAAEKFGAEVVQTAVGEVNVCLKMEEIGAEIGGEGNGGVILREAHLGRDSIVAILLVLQWIAVEKKGLGELLRGLKTFEIVKYKFDYLPAEKSEIQQKVSEFAGKQASLGRKIISVDGVKIENERGWVHVRFSNTEFIVRVFAEAESVEEAKGMAEEVIGEIGLK